MTNPASEEALGVKRLTYAKYLLRSANVSLRSPSSLVAAQGLLRLHDSIEIFQSVALDKIGVPKQKYGAFMEFWERVKEKTNVEPPYKDRFRALNDLRSSFKHQALLPNAEEVRELASVVPLFFDEVCRNLFAFHFAEISLGNLMPEGEVRNRVKTAERLAEAKDFCGAAGELAIVMELLFGTMFPDIPCDDPWSSLFMSGHVSYKGILGRSGELGVGAVWALDDCLDEIQSQIEELRHVVSLVAWGVDLRDYVRFRTTTPNARRSPSGDYECFWRHEIRPTYDDIGFCLQFVIDTALNVEARRHDAPPGARALKARNNG
jgi:hypothetical protein